MKELFLKNSISLITSYKKYSKSDIEKLRYGLEGIYLTIYKLAIIMLVSLLLKTFKETIILLILFNIIRYPAFGFHANTSTECLITSLLLLLGIPFLLLNININIYIKLGLSIFCLINFILYAPADTIKRPLLNSKKRKIRKLCSIVCCLIYAILSLLLNNHYISDLLLASMLIESILINPLIYKIFKQPYRNYLNY